MLAKCLKQAETGATKQWESCGTLHRYPGSLVPGDSIRSMKGGILERLSHSQARNGGGSILYGAHDCVKLLSFPRLFFLGATFLKWQTILIRHLRKRRAKLCIHEHSRSFLLSFQHHVIGKDDFLKINGKFFHVDNINTY